MKTCCKVNSLFHYLLCNIAFSMAVCASAEELRIPLDKPFKLGSVSIDSLLLDLVTVQGASIYWAGADKDPDVHDDERPRHAVEIPGLLVLQREVTNNQFDAWIAGLPRGVAIEGARQSGETSSYGSGETPVWGVSPIGAKLFCRWLSEKSGRLFRLPTEAEWEYLCRGGQDGAYWFDVNGESGHASDNEVSELGSNPFGLAGFDAGIAEWVSTFYAPYDSHEQAITRGERRSQIPMLFSYAIRGGLEGDELHELRITNRRKITDVSWGATVAAVWMPFVTLDHTDGARIGFRVVSPIEDVPREEWEEWWRFPWDDTLEVHYDLPNEWRKFILRPSKK